MSVKNVRTGYVLNFKNRIWPLPSCADGFGYDALQLRKVEEQLGDTKQIFDILDVNQHTINDATEMFIFLNNCPHETLSFWIKFWPEIKEELINEASPQTLLLSFNRIMKNQKDDSLKGVFEQVVKFIRSSWISPLSVMNEEQSRLINHPVHIIDKSGKLSVSAFIPFCGIGKSFLGKRIPEFSIPVCNKFNERTINDQLCYEIDPNNIANEKTELVKDGLFFIIDENRDKQFDPEKNVEIVSENEGFFSILQIHQGGHGPAVYLNTIGS